MSRRAVAALALVACSGFGESVRDVPDASPAPPVTPPPPAEEPPRILLFSKTTAFRHASIPRALEALRAAAASRGIGVDATEDAAVFTDAKLAAYRSVVFVLTSGDVLDAAQEAALERFLRGGRGFCGVHSATDTEYDWPFYGSLVGAYFSSHPATQRATVTVERRGHLATRHLPARWSVVDEWYSFRASPRPGSTVLLSVDERTYDVGASAMGRDHPIAWVRAHEGARVFYTGLGHTEEAWSDADFLAHVTGGLEWTLGRTSDRALLEEVDGASPAGDWLSHDAPPFRFDVSRDRLTMFDSGVWNQHVARRGVSIDPSRPYRAEALFTIHGPGGEGTDINSFAINLNVAGKDGDSRPPSTWAMNVDVSKDRPGGVMKHMGFVDGRFAQIGETPAPWAKKGVEYLMRVEVNRRASGEVAPGFLSVEVLEAGDERARFEVDYRAFPYQPTREPVRFGLNTHFTDWTVRGLSVHYLD